MSIPNAPFGLLSNAPMQTQLVDNQRSVTPPWGGWLNFLRQWLFLNLPNIFPSGTTFGSADPLANGAVGNGVTDDTAIVQATINGSGGQLYLRPNSNFLCSSTLTFTGNNATIQIFGGGKITSSASPAVSIASQASNIYVQGVTLAVTAATTVLSIASCTGVQIQIFASEFISNGICINLNANALGASIVGCYFKGGAGTTGVSLTNQSLVDVIGCTFLNGTPVVNAAGSTFDIRGSDTNDAYRAGVSGGAIAIPATSTDSIVINIGGVSRKIPLI